MRTRVSFGIFALLFVLAGAAWADAPEDKFFDSDGVKIRYITIGKGEPVLLIHGYTANIEMQWGPVLGPLAEKYQVIALDNRGHGKSDKPHGAEHYGEEMINDSIRLLDHLGVEKAHVVGYSMGGFITGKLVTMYPDRVLSATVGGAGWAEDSDERNGLMDLLADSIENHNNIAPLIEYLTPEGETVSEEQINMFNTMIMTNNDPKALASVARGMKGHAVAQTDLEKIDVPVQLIIGEIDPLKDAADAWMAVRKDDRCVVIDGADHMNAFGNGQFLEGLTSFLEENSK